MDYKLRLNALWSKCHSKRKHLRFHSLGNALTVLLIVEPNPMDDNWRSGKEGPIEEVVRGGRQREWWTQNVFNDRQMGKKIKLAGIAKMPVKLCKVSRQQNEIQDLPTLSNQIMPRHSGTPQLRSVGWDRQTNHLLIPRWFGVITIRHFS